MTVKRSPLSLFALVLLSAMLLAMPLHAASNQPESGAEKQQRFDALTKEMKKLKKLLGQFTTQRSDLQQALQKSETQIGRSQQKISSIETKLSAQRRQLKDLQGRRKTLNSAKLEQEQLIDQQIVAAYQMGQQNKIKLLLNQQQPDTVSRAVTYYDYFNKARSAQLARYADTLEQLNSIEPEILATTERLSTAKAQLDGEHQALLQQQKLRQSNLAKINRTIRSEDQRLTKIKLDRKQLERLLAAVEQSLANISIPSDYKSFISAKGKLAWPVTGKPSNRFGSHRSGSALRWQGLNIPARAGSQVNAIHHGRIVFADWLRGSGLLVIVDHGDGYMSLYAHNQSLLKQTGDWITAGETIATVGNSGGQLQAGLYFEIRHKGKPTDPKRWCRRV